MTTAGQPHHKHARQLRDTSKLHNIFYAPDKLLYRNTGRTNQPRKRHVAGTKLGACVLLEFAAVS
jgi:hypothetical protein